MNLTNALSNILFLINERADVLASLLPTDEDFADTAEWAVIDEELKGSPLPNSYGEGWGAD